MNQEVTWIFVGLSSSSESSSPEESVPLESKINKHEVIKTDRLAIFD